MLRRVLFIGLLMLPGSFVVLSMACVHPRLRRKIVQMAGLSRPLECVGRAYSAARRQPREVGFATLSIFIRSEQNRESIGTAPSPLHL